MDAALKQAVVVALGMLAGAALVCAYGYGPVYLSGPAEVIDGDNLKVTGYNIRLAGIEAPELPVRSGKACRKLLSRQECLNGSSIALHWRVGGKRVACWITGDGLSSRGDWDRPLGVCFHDGTELNAWMLRECHAGLPDDPQHRVWRYRSVAAKRDCRGDEAPVARLDNR